MESTTTVAKFREKLANWLDSAEKKVVYIHRGDQRFALMNVDIYNELNQKISDLQAGLIAALESKNLGKKDQKPDILSQLEKYKREQA